MPPKKPSRAAQAAMRLSGRDAVADEADALDLDAALEGLGVEAEQLELEGTPDALLAALGAEDPRTRSAAALGLGATGNAAYAAPLKARLSDPAAEVRAAVVTALAQLDHEALLPEIIKALRHETPRVVSGAALALGRLRAVQAVPNLLEAFKTNDPTVAAAVSWALGRCGDRSAVPWLAAALRHGVAPASCCEALGRLGDPRAASPLMEALRSEQVDVRAHAARALGRLDLSGDEQATRIASVVVTALRGVAADAHRRVRLCAALSLYDLGERAAGEGVRAALQAKP